MSKYAVDTSVSSDRSRAEIENTLRRYGADKFAYLSARDHAVIAFEAHDRRVRFELPMPDPAEQRFHLTPARKNRRSPAQAQAEWEQACRQKWRALALCVKAKLEAVEAEITTFEDEFLAHIVLPDGRTVSDHALPGVERAYATNTANVPLLGNF